jgi:hypothetical protein
MDDLKIVGVILVIIVFVYAVIFVKGEYFTDEDKEREDKIIKRKIEEYKNENPSANKKDIEEYKKEIELQLIMGSAYSSINKANETLKKYYPKKEGDDTSL